MVHVLRPFVVKIQDFADGPLNSQTSLVHPIQRTIFGISKQFLEPPMHGQIPLHQQFVPPTFGIS